MEMDEESKATLEKIVATTQLRLALETEEERRARLNICRITKSIHQITYTLLTIILIKGVIINKVD